MPASAAPLNPYTLPLTKYGVTELKDLLTAIEAELLSRAAVAVGGRR